MEIILTSEEVESGEICCIKVTNRQVLLAYIDTFTDERPYTDYLKVGLAGEKLGCLGGSATYKTKEDVPYHSVPCPCGNPKHWFIKYEED